MRSILQYDCSSPEPNAEQATESPAPQTASPHQEPTTESSTAQTNESSALNVTAEPLPLPQPAPEQTVTEELPSLNAYSQPSPYVASYAIFPSANGSSYPLSSGAAGAMTAEITPLRATTHGWVIAGTAWYWWLGVIGLIFGTFQASRLLVRMVSRGVAG